MPVDIERLRALDLGDPYDIDELCQALPGLLAEVERLQSAVACAVACAEQRVAAKDALQAENAELRRKLELVEAENATLRWRKLDPEQKRLIGVEHSELRADKDRLDWLDDFGVGVVRGTDVPKWSIEAEDESVVDIRAAIDAARKAGA